MKGNNKLIQELNALLAEELTAINQYMVHAEMCENWGFGKLAKSVKARSVTEMKHAEKLIERIIFLDSQPIVSKLNDIHIGPDVPKQVANDLTAETDAVKHYNSVIKLAVEVADNATKEILDGILNDEDSHVNDLEEKRDEIAMMGLQNFLVTQV